jgi:hypothetical protein
MSTEKVLKIQKRTKRGARCKMRRTLGVSRKKREREEVVYESF